MVEAQVWVPPPRALATASCLHSPGPLHKQGPWAPKAEWLAPHRLGQLGKILPANLTTYAHPQNGAEGGSVGSGSGGVFTSTLLGRGGGSPWGVEGG